MELRLYGHQGRGKEGPGCGERLLTRGKVDGAAARSVANLRLKGVLQPRPRLALLGFPSVLE